MHRMEHKTYGTMHSIEAFRGDTIMCRPGMLMFIRERLFAHDDYAPVAVVVGEWLHGVTEGLYRHAALVDTLLL